MGNVLYTTRAAFWFDSTGWTWVRWTHKDSNVHAALIAKASEIGARGYDSGNADHEETSRYNFATR